MTCVSLSLIVFTVNLWVAVTPADAAAGINKTINFQGKLVDNNGLNVANGTYTVIFAIYDDSSLGVNTSCGSALHCKWAETDTVSVSNGDGIFQVQLGLNTPLPGNVDFNTDNLYLGIKVNSDAEMLPRIQFTAVPYAFNAQKVNGLTVQNATGNPLTGAVLQIPDNKTVQFGGAFNSGSNDLSFTTSAGTTVTFPGSGSITLVDQASTQTLTSKTIGSTGLTFSGAATDVTTVGNEDFTLTPSGSGKVILTTDADTGVYIGGNAGNTLAPLSISGGIGANAALIINNLNSGDLISASASGTTKFRVANNGDLMLSAGINPGGTGTGNNTQCLLGGSTVSWGACGSGTNFWRLPNNGTFSFMNDTMDFLFGGSASTSAKFKLSPSGTSPVASVAGSTSFASMVVNNTGSGDILAASKSGATKFVIQNSGKVTLDTANYSSCGTLGTDILAQITCGVTGNGDQLLGVYTITNPSGTNLHIVFNGAVDATPASASGTITFPANTTKMQVEVKAGGGGGGGVGGGTAVVKDAGGGGEGSYAKKFITSLTSDYYLKVGGGGNGGTTAGTNGSQGTASCIGTNAADACNGAITTAFGGNGGTGVTVTGAVAGGAGGTAVGGDINLTGQPGFASNTLASAAWGGAGGGTSGAPATIASGNGTNGSNGGGGSGGADVTAVATTRTGGNGGNGYMLIYLYKNSSTGASGADGWYQYLSGVLAPNSQTTDVLIGSNATSSAKFGFINVNSGTPTASVSAGNAGAAFLTAAGLLQTTAKQTLALGGGATGDISFAPGNAQSLYLASNGQVSLSNAAYANCGTLSTAANVVTCSATAGGLVRLVNGAYSFGNDTADFVFGNVATASADFKLSSVGTAPTAFVSSSTSYAALAVNNSGSGDLLTASRAGTPKFTILNNGTIQANNYNTAGAVLYTDAAGNFGETLQGLAGQCLTSNVGSAPTWAACDAVGASYWQLNAGALSSFSGNADILFGSTATASAKFAFINNSGTGEPTASIAGSITLRNGVGNINRLNGGSLNFQTSVGGDGGLSTKLYIANSGQIGIGTNNINPGATLDIKGNSGTQPVTSITGQTSFAGLVVDNTGVGDIFAASKSGATKFVINNNGNVGINTAIATALLDVNGAASVSGSLNFRTGAGAIQTTGKNTLTLGGITTGDISFAPGGTQSLYLASNGQVSLSNAAYANCGTLSTASNIITCSSVAGGLVRLVNGAYSFGNDTADFVFGNVATASADFKLSSVGTAPTVLANGNTSFAEMALNNSGSGDLFTASRSGTPKFTILNNGNVQVNNYNTAGGVLYTDGTGTIGDTLQGLSGQCLTSNVGAAPTWSACDAAGASYWQLNAGALSPFSANADLLIGSTATASAKFAFINNSGTGEPTASIAGSITLRNGVGNINRLNGGSLNFQTSPGGDAGLTTKLFISNSGLVGIGTNSINPTATLDVEGNSGTLPVTSITGQTSYAGLVINNTGSGDILAASKSGATKFVINNNGNVGINTAIATALLDVNGAASLSGSLNFRTGAGAIQTTGRNTLTLGGLTTGDIAFAPGGAQSLYLASNGQVSLSNASYANCGALSTAANVVTCSSAANGLVRLINGAYSFGNDTADFLFASSASTSAKFKLSPSGTSPTASVAGATSYATMVVNNTGSGDLFAASKSGATKFVITNAGTVGIGTSIPTAATELQVSAIGTAQTNDLVNFSNATGQEPTLTGVNALQLQWYAKPAVANLTGAQRININNTNTLTGGTAAGLVVNATGPVAGVVNSATDGLYILGLNNASVATTNQNAIQVGANWDSSLFGDGDLRINANGNIILATSSASTKIGIGTATPLATLDVRAHSATQPVASFSGSTNFAALVVNNTGSGDLISASTAGLTRFTVKGNGNVIFGGDTITASSAGATNNGSPALINGLGDTGSLVPNGSFEAVTSAGLGFADGWVRAASSAALLTIDSASSAHGSNSVKATLGAGGVAAFYGTCIPLNGALGIYNLSNYIKTNVASPTVRAYIDGYTTKANCVSNTGMTTSNTATFAVTAAYALPAAVAITPAAGTTWGRVHYLIASGQAVTVNIDGVRLIESALTGGLDYAENYPADPANMPEAGDLVSLQAVGRASQVTKASHSMDASVIGVVSTKPGYVLDDGTMGERKVSVALAGRIPTKVSTQNGAIHIGDYLTSSGIPGVAVKAITAGPVIGQAMEEYDADAASQIGSVLMFVKNTYYNGIPLTLDSGLRSDTQQDDLQFLGTLVEQSIKQASAAGSLVTIHADKVVAGLSIVSPVVTTDKLNVNTIKAASGKDVGIELSDGGTFVIKDASGTATIAFDNKGNAVFTGTITANKLQVNQIEGLSMLQSGLKQQEILTASLSAMFANRNAVLHSLPAAPDLQTSANEASIAALLSKYDSGLFSIQALSVSQNARVSGNLRVQGNSLIEGILNVVDMLTANNLIVNKVADFFGQVIFHSDVTFQGRPIFNSDTAGTAFIKEGSDHVDVRFKDEYKNTPVVSATEIVSQITKSPNQSDEAQAQAQKDIEAKVLGSSTRFIVTRVTAKGFVIVLNKPATDAMTFSWTALAVADPKDSIGSSLPVPTNPVPTPIVPSTTPENKNNQTVQKGGDVL